MTLQARFEGDLDVSRIITELGILHRKPIEPGNTLVSFDEIQFCNRALTALKYFCFGQVRKGWRVKDLEDALEWLIRAELAVKVMRIEKPFLPLSSYTDPTFFKLYMSDVGLAAAYVPPAR